MTNNPNRRKRATWRATVPLGIRAAFRSLYPGRSAVNRITNAAVEQAILSHPTLSHLSPDAAKKYIQVLKEQDDGNT